MSMRIAALALLLIAVPAAGQTLERGKEMKGSGARYQHLPQAAAVVLSEDETPDQALERIGESGAQILERKGRLVLFRSATVRQASLASAGDSKVYPAVVNAHTGVLGVLTGSLVVRPKSMDDADAIARAHGLQKIKAYPHLQTVFYKVKEGADIADACAALQADPRVEIAYPEIIERVRVPR